MNQMQKRAMDYMNAINQMIEKTQKVQEHLNPLFEEITQAIEKKTLKDMQSAKYLEIQGEFQEGTNEYKKIAKNMKTVKAPAKLMGIQHNLTAAYVEYGDACQAMVDSMKER